MYLILFSNLSLSANITGSFKIIDSEESLSAQKEAALQNTLSALNPLLRYPASRRLSTEPPKCDRYQINNTSEGVSIRCDSKRTLQLITGKQSQHITADGQNLKVTFQSQSNGIHFKLIGESGLMSTQMQMHNDKLTVIKSVESPHLPVPLTMTYTYKKVTP